MSKKFSFVVTVTVAEEVMEDQLREHIADAVAGWGEGVHPDHPLHLLNEKDVEVKRYKRRSTSADRDKLVVAARGAEKYLAGLKTGSSIGNFLAISSLRAALEKFPEETS